MVTKPSGRSFLKRIRETDLQSRVILILVLVIFPISFFLGIVQSKVMEPILNEEVRQVGYSFAQTLGSQIESQRLLMKANPTPLIEDRIQRMMYSQPSILRVDVIKKLPNENRLVYIASSVEDQDLTIPSISALKPFPTAEITKEEDIPVWSIYLPVRNGNEMANIHVLASLRFVSAIQATTLKINLIAALMSTILLILVLSFFLRRAIENERQLKVAQLSNEVLSGRLQEIQQELLHTEKLAVMGQLTASFAHEIGTPLNAIGGHIQLLNMDLEKALPKKELGSLSERLGVITGQIRKIEDIVKGFLQTTKKPLVQQRSTVPASELVDGILALVIPTLQRYQISFGKDFSAKNDLIEVVPLEIEQVLLNLVNNAVDSMKELAFAQRAKDPNSPIRHALWIRTYQSQPTSLTIEIQDSGTGITKDNLKQIFKPFFTTKSAGEGHGLGLSICQQIIRSYGGDVLVESTVGKGTKMKVVLPVKA